jgi:hypothetical protein
MGCGWVAGCPGPGVVRTDHPLSWQRGRGCGRGAAFRLRGQLSRTPQYTLRSTYLLYQTLGPIARACVSSTPQPGM